MDRLNSKTPYIFILFLTGIYFFLGTNNSNIDSWYYAACVKHNVGLFNSHHLLYNYFGRLLYLGLQILNPNIEGIKALQFMNALAAGFSLILFYKLILKLSNKPQSALFLTLLCGVSYGFIRFATDAETYILPILASIISTTFFISNRKTGLFLAGVFGALSVLIHQLHIWWTLALLISFFLQRPISLSKIFIYLLPLFSIPIVYFYIYTQFSIQEGFMSFILGQYINGNAGLDISFNSFAYTFINLIRTFFQIHGQIIYLLKYHMFLFGLGIVVICILIIIAVLKTKISFKYRDNSPLKPLQRSLVFAFLLHLIFAFLSSGNAEFMVMLPFLLVLILSIEFDFNINNYSYLILSVMLIWNLVWSILPSHYFNINKYDQQVAISISMPSAALYWNDKVLIENIVSYKKGFDFQPNFLPSKNVDKDVIDSILLSNTPIYTDLSNHETRFSRKNLFNEINSDDVLSQYHLLAIDSFNNIYGKNYIFLIKGRK